MMVNGAILFYEHFGILKGFWHNHLQKNHLLDKYFFLFGLDCWEDVTYENFFSSEI
jgi:hypothetical protein